MNDQQDIPETSDSNFSWSEYVRRNNDALVATFGNLVHRVFSMTTRYLDGVVPPPKDKDNLDNSLILNQCLKNKN